jgi:iron complex transport system permease protein
MAVLVSYRLRDTMAILIVGLMFGSLTSAIVEHSLISVLLSNYKNLPSGPWESGNLSWTSNFIPLRTSGCFLSLFSIKPLNALLLGRKLCP